MHFGEKVAPFMYGGTFLIFPHMINDAPMNMAIYYIMSLLAILGISIKIERKNWKVSIVFILTICFTLSMIINYTQTTKGTPIPGMEYTQEYVSVMMWAAALVCGVVLHAVMVIIFGLIALFQIAKIYFTNKPY